MAKLMRIFVILAIVLVCVDCSLIRKISQSKSNRHFQRNCELASEYGASNQPKKLRGLLLKFVDEPTEMYVLTHHVYNSACQHGNVEALRMLVEEVGLPEGYFRMIGLGIAVRSGQEDIIEYMLLWGMLDNPDDQLQAIDIAESSGGSVNPSGQGMNSRQAVIELGSWTAKAGLWEQTFLPTHIIPSFAGRNADGSLVFGKEAWARDEACRAYSIVDGRIADIEILEALIRHILRDELMVSEPWGDVYVLLVIPAAWDVPVQAQLLRLMFERFGVAGLYLGEAPVMAAFGCGTMNCMVVDVGHSGAECSVVWDGQLVRAASGERFPVGGKDLMKALGAYSSNGWDALDPESHSVNAALDLFFAGEGVQHLLVNTILPLMEQERRPALLEAVVVTGLGSQVPGLGARLLSAIKALLPASEYYGEHQGKKAALRRVPEYYTEVCERATPVAAWFGAGITSKMVFPDPRAYYGREEFAQHGPLLLHSKPL